MTNHGFSYIEENFGWLKCISK